MVFLKMLAEPSLLSHKYDIFGGLFFVEKYLSTLENSTLSLLLLYLLKMFCRRSCKLILSFYDCIDSLCCKIWIYLPCLVLLERLCHKPHMFFGWALESLFYADFWVISICLRSGLSHCSVEISSLTSRQPTSFLSTTYASYFLLTRSKGMKGLRVTVKA